MEIGLLRLINDLFKKTLGIIELKIPKLSFVQWKKGCTLGAF